MAAIRGLERSRRLRAAAMLEESRARLGAAAQSAALHPTASREEAGPRAIDHRRPSAAPNLTAPPPITEVLRDLYEEEKKTA